jgi:hypothetical protein
MDHLAIPVHARRSVCAGLGRIRIMPEDNRSAAPSGWNTQQLNWNAADSLRLHTMPA